MRQLQRLVAMLLLCSVLTACALQKEDGYFSYRQKSFCATIEGTLFGLPFTAVLTHVQSENKGRESCIRYHSPQGLHDILITYRGTDNAQIESGELQIQLSTAKLDGLLSPLAALLDESEILTVKKEGKQTVLTLENGGILRLFADGTPQSFYSDSVAFRIVTWEYTR